MRDTVLLTYDTPEKFKLISVGQLFRFIRYGQLFVKVDEDTALAVGEYPCPLLAHLSTFQADQLQVFVVCVVEKD